MAFPRFVSPYGASVALRNYSQPYGLGFSRRVRVRRRMGLAGLGAVSLTANPFRISCPAWGCEGPPIPRVWSPGQPIAPPPPAQPIAAAAASGPVPAGFPTNQIFMAPDGSQWVYSTAQGTWVNVGTPYNLSAASPPPAVSTSSPSGPTVGQTYTDPTGNVWTYNGTQWALTTNAATAASIAAASTSGAAPVSVTVAPPTTSPYDSIINFLTGESLISGVPNWIVGAGLFLGYKLVSSKMGSGRR